MSQDNSPQNDAILAQCPKCQSQFRLTQQHLNAAKGWVQCGVCGNVFFSGMQTPAAAGQAFVPGAPAATPQPPSPQASPVAPISASAPSEEMDDFPEIGSDEGPHTETPSSMLSGLSNRMAVDENAPPSTMSFGPKLVSIMLMGNEPPTEEDLDPGPLPVIPARPEPPRPGAIPAGINLGQPLPSNSPRPASATNAPYGNNPGNAPYGSNPGNAPYGNNPGNAPYGNNAGNANNNWTPHQASAAPSQPGRRSAAVRKQLNSEVSSTLWLILAFLLIVMLGVQVVWFKRDDFVASYPQLRPVYRHLCTAIGCTLSLPRDPTEVVILGSDLQTVAENRMALNLNLANKANNAMAWPVLELTLTDVEDQPLARKVFAPSEYLSPASRVEEGVPPTSETPITLNLEIKDIKAAGYRVRTFY